MHIPNDEGGKFFKSVMAQNGMPQGIWIVSPQGETLAYHYFKARDREKYADSQRRWVAETLAAVEEGLRLARWSRVR